MEVHSNGGADFARLAAKFKAAGKDGAAIRKALTKTIQKELKKIVVEQQQAAKTMTVKDTKGRGAGRREAYHASKKKRASRTGHGLRATTAGAIKSKVAYTGRKIGARIYVDPAALPQSQRKLPRYLNRPKGWRHPTWAHRDRWVQQVGEPYFTHPINRHRDAVRRAVDAAVKDVMRTLK